MLMLSRKPGQSFVVLPPGQPPIEVLVHRLHGNRATLGIRAPAEVGIVRGELLREEREEREPPRQEAPAP